VRQVVCMITDRLRLGEAADAALVRRVALAARAGIHLVQIRERDMPDGALARLVAAAVAATHRTRTRILVNDRLDVAIAAGETPSSRLARFPKMTEAAACPSRR